MSTIYRNCHSERSRGIWFWNVTLKSRPLDSARGDSTKTFSGCLNSYALRRYLSRPRDGGALRPLSLAEIVLIFDGTFILALSTLPPTQTSSVGTAV